MKTTITLAAIVGVALLAGCSSEATQPITDDELKQMISEAASMPNDVFDQLAGMTTLGMTVSDISDQTLTNTLMFTPFVRQSFKDENVGARKAEFEMLPGQADRNRNAALIEALCRRSSGPGVSGRANYTSFIHPEYITALTRNVEGDTMTGTVSFEAGDVYRGRVQYTARCGGDGWRMVEFCMPAWGLRTALAEDGLWRAWIRPGPDGPAGLGRDVKIELPKINEDRRSASATKLITVNIRKDGSYVVGGKLLTRPQLQGVLTEAVKADSGQKVLVRGDGDAAHKHFARCISDCRAAGISQVNIGYDFGIPERTPKKP